MENINKYNKYKSNIAKYKQIMSYVQNLFSNYDRICMKLHDSVYALFMDLSEAFNNINHDLLVQGSYRLHDFFFMTFHDIYN